MIVRRFVQCEMRSRVHAWLARVPSPSNLADLPSKPARVCETDMPGMPTTLGGTGGNRIGAGATVYLEAPQVLLGVSSSARLFGGRLGREHPCQKSVAQVS